MRTLHTTRTRLLAVAAASATLLVTGCDALGGSDEGSASRSGPDGESTAAATVTSTPLAEGAPDGLETFYEQRLVWSSCEGDFECSSLTVPLDYAEPDGATIDLALLRSPASGTSQGSLVVNPGGPGGSGVDYAMTAAMVVSGPVREAYDVVGFDPRGVARSAPITCLTDEEMDTYLSSDPSPDDAAEEAAGAELAQDFAEACGEAAPDLVRHVSTPEAARDIDVLRAALGDETLTYLGASYGTFLGATYAALFPDRVGRLVLEGAVDPQLTGREMGQGQAE